MKVVVTGGAGFIGANLCRALSQQGEVDEVVAVDNLSTGFRSNLDGVARTRLAEVDILDRGALEAALDGASSVVHLAARPNVPKSLTDPRASHHANATGTLEVLEACRVASVGHVVLASSSSVYGANRELPKREDMAAAPLSPYAASKLALEAYARAYTSSFGLQTLTFRFFNVFGPLQPAGHAYAAVVPAFVDAALAGRPVTVHSDGLQTRDFTYVDSVTSVLTSAVLQKASNPGPVNLAFGTRVSLLELLDLLGSKLGAPVQREHVPTRAGDVRDSQADQTLLRSVFPDLAPVSLSDGLDATIAWFRSSGA